MAALLDRLGKLLRRASAVSMTRTQIVNDGQRACDAAHSAEPPVSFAELMAASSFVDFGGILDARWLPAWRIPEERRQDDHQK
jgi:hypothetical protein